MASFDNSYSRLITWLKILLPLTALAILSTLFLVSRSIDPFFEIPFAQNELQELAREPKIGNPSFSGISDNGSAIDLSADVGLALTGEQSGIKTVGLSGVFETPDGLKVDITAQTGAFDTKGRQANLSDGVSLITSTGYQIITDSIVADLNSSSIYTIGSITAIGPLGRISAGRLILRQKNETEAGTMYELVFQDGVKLIYIPQQY